MNKATLKVPLSSKAYLVFLDEVARYRERICTVLSALELDSSDLRRELSAVFHTIKGGAGFFGLDDLADTSAQLETMLAGPQTPSLSVVVPLLNHFVDISGNMPKPE